MEKLQRCTGMAVPDNMAVVQKKTLRGSTEQLIRQAILDSLSSGAGFPTKTKISEMTGLSRMTINRAIKEINFDSYIEEYRMLTKDVLTAVFHSAQQGNTAAQRLWLETVEKIRPGIDVKMGGEFNHNINVNFV